MTIESDKNADFLYSFDLGSRDVMGETPYIDDIPLPEDAIQVFVQGSEIACGEIMTIDLTDVKNAKGVIDVIELADFPGKNALDLIENDLLLSGRNISYLGQPVFAVAANSVKESQDAAKLAKIKYQQYQSIISIEDAIKSDSKTSADLLIKRGRSATVIAKAEHKTQGKFSIGGQEHAYLETQRAIVIPSANDELSIYSSTQKICDVQEIVAKALNLSPQKIVVENRRLGGAFGGKHVPSSKWAVIAALFAMRTGKSVSLILDREGDLVMTGKMPDFMIEYEAGFNENGLIEGLEIVLATRCGHGHGVSEKINRRAMLHIDNCYYIKDISIISKRYKTNTHLSEAMRGCGAAQGMMVIERIMDEIARELDLDPLIVRLMNLYDQESRNITPYGMRVKDNVLPQLIEQLKGSSSYTKRRKLVKRFNQSSPIIKRGMALIPVKYGVELTQTFLDQVCVKMFVDDDGFVHLTHGSTEMGQGVFQKLALTVAKVLHIKPDFVKIRASNTDDLSNALGSASGSLVNIEAVNIAAQEIKHRLIDFASKKYKLPKSEVLYTPLGIRLGKKTLQFKTLVHQAKISGGSLSVQGFFSKPKIKFNEEKLRGRPFYFFVFGAALAEVEVDTLTGESNVLRADILQDCGNSISTAIDIGQIEGGFVQGMGWLTKEELIYNDEGRLLTNSFETYKIPNCLDMPDEFNVRIFKNKVNHSGAVFNSKFSSEASVMLAISVYSALRQAVAEVNLKAPLPNLNAPVTPARILSSIY